MKHFVKYCFFATLFFIGQAEARTVVIGVYGDSTMFGSTCASRDAKAKCVYSQSSQNAPATLLRLLQNQFPNDTIVVKNHGVPGSYGRDWLFGFRDVPFTFQQAMENFTEEQIVIMNVGINDAFLNYSDVDINYMWEQFAHLATQNGKIFVVETANPILDSHNQRLGEIAQIERNLAIRYRLPIVDQYSWLTANYNLPILLPDGIHPNDYLYGVKGWYQFHMIEPIVASLL